MKKFLLTVLVGVIIFSVSACKKKEEQPIPQLPAEQGPVMDSPAMPQHDSGQKTQFNVVVPPGVKDKWSGVKLLVKDKKLNTTQEVVVKLGDELKIPDSKLTVRVGVFLPDFKMGVQIITSASNSLNNPAVGVLILENGAQIFPESGEWGWLYSKHPDIHPFQHERFTLILEEGIEKQ
jgi:hypothetical protein